MYILTLYTLIKVHFGILGLIKEAGPAFSLYVDEGIVFLYGLCSIVFLL